MSETEEDKHKVLVRSLMAFSVVFLVSVIMALVAILSIPKRDTAIKWFPLCVLLQTGTACLIFGFMNKLGVAFSLLIPIFVNVAITIVCALVLMKKKIFPRWSVDSSADASADANKGEPLCFKLATRSDVAAFCMILVTTVVVFFVQFSPDIYAVFSSGDAARHLQASINISRGESGGGSLFFSRFFTACFISVASPFLDTMDYCKVFIFCETFLFLLSACMFYTLISTIAKNAHPAVLLILTLLYMLGFPWNNLVIGFSYLGTGVTLITAIIFVCYRFDLIFKNVRDLPGLLFLTLLLSSLTVSYSLFIPPVFLAVFVYMVIAAIREKATPVQAIISFGTVFIVPVLTFLVFTGLQTLTRTTSNTPSNTGSDAAASSNTTTSNTANTESSASESGASNKPAPVTTNAAVSAMALDGYAFRDIFAGALFILPLSLYGMVLRYRDEKLTAINLIAAIFMVYQLIFLAGVFVGILGTYYYSKLNYVLWLILFSYAVFGIEELRTRSRKLLACYASIWLVLLLMVFTGLNKFLGEKEPELYNSNTLAGIFSVYDYNIENCDILQGVPPSVGKDDLALYGKGLELEENGQSVMVIGDDRTVAWYNVLTDSKAGINYWDYTDEELIDLLKDTDYLIIRTTYRPWWETKSGTSWQDLVDKLTEDTMSVWSNSGGHVLKVKK